MHSILIVDDEKVQAGILGEILSQEGFDVTTSNDPEEAITLVQNQSFDLVLSDLKMQKMNGIGFLQEVRRLIPDITVIIMTAYGTVETAVKAMREGAFDYVLKPFSKEEILISVERAVKNMELLRENVYLRGKLGLEQGAVRLIGTSKAMQDIFRMVSKIAQDDTATVLIQGETGTGKDLIARSIHQLSPRREAPFITVNCAAIPEGLMESEFFGHEKGAFTGATSSKPGRFELADQGTLFLDEVGEMDGYIQGKLLRVLETREFERVGGTRTHRVNVRIVAATNRNLSREVQAGRFREDLFYRLNIVPITLPPLRDRREDLPMLAEFFLDKFHAEGKRRMRLSPEALEVLLRYDYPGNIRELENLLERAVILSDHEVITASGIHIEAAEPATAPAPAGTGMGLSLSRIGKEAAEYAEKTAILRALQKTHWNRLKAAKVLNIDYKTLRIKIRRYNLFPGGEGSPPEK